MNQLTLNLPQIDEEATKAKSRAAAGSISVISLTGAR